VYQVDIMGDAAGKTTVELPRDHVALGTGFALRVVSESGGEERVFAARGDRTVIGSHESADVVLGDRSVSRFHCEILVGEDGARLRDLGSRNGTLIRGVRVVEAHLANGDVISVGRTSIRFETRADPVTAALSPRDRFGMVLGRSVAMRRLFAVLERAASTDATVLIEGETGTGKEVVAESIHQESARRAGPFIVVDCSAIPRDLLESELFGHEKGAFTGAVAARTGAFLAASGGTLFLDEIGELGPELQPRLLRALESRKVKPVGSDALVDFDVRLVAATNRNLRASVNSGIFRADLYYRLAVVEIGLPPLRQRTDDLPMLVSHLAKRLGVAAGSGASLLDSPEFLADIARHAWPGNVRELRNYVERCLVLQTRAPLGGPVVQGELGDADLVDLDLGYKVARERWTQVCERRYLEGQLARSGGNISAAARAMGIDRIYLYRILWRHGLR
jgi:two-component system response regulator GlrR